MSWLFGDSLSGDNHQDPLGEAGAKFQKWTDPLAMIFGGKFVDLTSRKIPTEVNRSLSKITGPIDKVDQQINPMRPLTPGADAIGKWVSNKPGSTIGAVVGAAFAAPAVAGAAGAGAAGGSGAAGGVAGGAEAGTAGASMAGGYGTGVSSSVLPGIFPGATVSTGYGGGAGLGTFSGSGVAGSLTGSASAGSGAGSFDWSNLIQQGVGNMSRQGGGSSSSQNTQEQRAADEAAFNDWQERQRQAIADTTANPIIPNYGFGTNLSLLQGDQ